VVTLRLVVAVVAGAALAATAGFWNARAQPSQEGRELYLANCAGCHGVSLEGQPDWQVRKPDGRLPAPPHDASGHTWHHSDAQLLRIIKEGLAAIAPGYESDMPAFEDKLTDAEITAILEYIKSTWPERERAYQAGRSQH
jgi:mono/diheme cytochrome c family protein